MLTSEVAVVKYHHSISVKCSRYRDTGPTDPSLIFSLNFSMGKSHNIFCFHPGCRSFSSLPSLRCLPLHNSCQTGHSTGERHPAGKTVTWPRLLETGAALYRDYNLFTIERVRNVNTVTKVLCEIIF